MLINNTILSGVKISSLIPNALYKSRGLGQLFLKMLDDPVNLQEVYSQKIALIISQETAKWCAHYPNRTSDLRITSATLYH